ncbi:hypothetical protein NF867_12240 [Solitalea sp. MAHUQ-68]|uniref:Entericidin EcnAB n=2 Tax=Solitalea TaxID=929509 RepID=A0A2S5A0K2_9SPHI|nr:MULTISPECIES: hypothetical protein [Solitalea]MCO4293636.1 hypothetical protein [Solitalea agri]POY35797.1 hypothetical protein C3K47_13680 [Solitalea longa]
MKKVFALLLAAGVFAVVACGEGKKAEGSADSAQVDSAQAATVDSLANAVDTTAKAVDSAKVDTLKK